MDPNNKFEVLSKDLDGLNINESLRSRIERLSELPIDQVFELKIWVESELSRLFDFLKQQGGDMESPLVTGDGYPRSDIDVLQIRLIRRSINMLRNDLKSIIIRAEALMATQFERMAAKTQKTERDDEFEYKIPFAVITEVVTTSPSEKAGLHADDRILRFGHVHAGNHKSLSALGLVVQSNEDKPVPVKIQRNDRIYDVMLTPSRKWDGPGLLGCRFSQL
ncbi:LAFE_0G10836g1_1 [Lachancea fermentati]|uniref:Probable 26S proteasome regulatory subunit p27 n=1 Tax=Lachancea fermentati TaxID=4955 RepID=A0A1G4MHR1_LACFM|nr:LAFE_0G10836g1_1 [Lachancea fermentati]